MEFVGFAMFAGITLFAGGAFVIAQKNKKERERSEEVFAEVVEAKKILDASKEVKVVGSTRNTTPGSTIKSTVRVNDSRRTTPEYRGGGVRGSSVSYIGDNLMDPLNPLSPFHPINTYNSYEDDDRRRAYDNSTSCQDSSSSHSSSYSSPSSHSSHSSHSSSYDSGSSHSSSYDSGSSSCDSSSCSSD